MQQLRAVNTDGRLNRACGLGRVALTFTQERLPVGPASHDPFCLAAGVRRTIASATQRSRRGEVGPSWASPASPA